jgi:hypothetical protein
MKRMLSRSLMFLAAHIIIIAASMPVVALH